MSKILPFSGRVVFDHLGKTGGMAVTSWLTDCLGHGTVTPDLVGNHSELIRRYGGLFPIISAHIIFDDGLDPRYDYVTLLRDPVDRVVSWLFYADNTVPDTPEFELHKKGARDFINSDGEIVGDEILSSISNYYVEHFAHIQRFSPLTFGSKFDAALQSLREFSVVGVYEKFSSFLLEVSNLVGVPAPESIARVNSTSHRPTVKEITPRLRARIVELNQLDIRLYEEVVAWKKSIEQGEPSKDVTHLAPRWLKYEPVRDKVVATPDVTVLAASLREDGGILHGQLMTFDVDFVLSRDVDELELGIHIFDDDRRWAFGINSTLLEQRHQNLTRGSYRVSYHLIANLPAGKYTAGFAMSERLFDGIRDLAWYDKLCEFEVQHRIGRSFAGYANLPAEIAFSPVKTNPEDLIVDCAPGSIMFQTASMEVLAGERVMVDVKVTNRGDQLWGGNCSRPIRLSYHWLDADGEMSVFDGERSPLPDGGIPVGRTVVTNMGVVAPSSPGSYMLVPTLVQEGVRWFDEVGLEAVPCAVVVIGEHHALPQEGRVCSSSDIPHSIG
ncbi:Wzt carbohydrate-binding domain-containing protein [Paraburkholderia aspalathi]|uniref:Wzt carbohydrate-binding domain-containing protein n=1 Tax=Paraburkholderia aspalathi TaxID=1324617 RepID=UPI0038BDBA4F